MTLPKTLIAFSRFQNMILMPLLRLKKRKLLKDLKNLKEVEEAWEEEEWEAAARKNPMFKLLLVVKSKMDQKLPKKRRKFKNLN